MNQQWTFQWKLDAYLSVYECKDCGIVWASIWDSGCDDECPECEIAYTPTHSWTIDEIVERMNASDEEMV